jgi:hypothetical protein
MIWSTERKVSAISSKALLSRITYGRRPIPREMVAQSPSSSTMLKNLFRPTFKLSRVRSKLSSQSGSLSTRLSSYTLTSRSSSPKIPRTTSPRSVREGSQSNVPYVSLQIPHPGSGSLRRIVLNGTAGLNCKCTLRNFPCDFLSRCKAWRTIRPEMMALVVAIAGMMFPAISARSVRMESSERARQTFDFPPCFALNAICIRAQIGGGCDKVERVVIILVKGDGILSIP